MAFPHLAVYPRVGRAGLGNMLVPWAKAEVFRSVHGVPMLAPRWTQPKLGPLLRRERDLRYYVGLFDDRAHGYIDGWRRTAMLRRYRRVPETEVASFFADPSPTGPSLVEFSNGMSWFDGLEPYRELIVTRLTGMLSRRTRERLAAAPQTAPIAVHVRRGDKPLMPFGQPFEGAYHGALPDEWFIGAIRAVRATVGSDVPVEVFSDDAPSSLNYLLALPGVRLAPPSVSIVDIYRMSGASVLITSGTSSFSGWGAFIGHIPTIWYPNTGRDLFPDTPGWSIETDLHGELDVDAQRQLVTSLEQAAASTGSGLG